MQLGWKKQGTLLDTRNCITVLERCFESCLKKDMLELIYVGHIN